LLSSLQGSAISSVKIDGVLHEFSTIPGVREDVTDVILNLKEVRLKLHGEEPKTIEVDKKSPRPSRWTKQVRLRLQQLISSARPR
jgi:DNA-directed RNA polymerase subunit alpha